MDQTRKTGSYFFNDNMGQYHPQQVYDGARSVVEMPPSGPFENLILYYQQVNFNRQSRPGHRYTVLPDACADIKIHCNPNKPEALICGTKKSSRPTLLTCDMFDWFTIRFWPGQFYRLFPLNAEEVTCHIIDMRTLSVPGLSSVLEQITLARTFLSRVLIWEKFLAGWQQKQTSIPDWIDYAVRLVYQSRGTFKIPELTQKLGYTDRHIRREFGRVIGLSPNCFSRIVRLQNALADLQTRPGDNLVDIALQYGFHDQSHFTHMFKQFFGKPPSSAVSEK